ncbi:NAD-dependent epimerase/dehydratase family protein [Actinophytocola sp.]|uniref:NAD-dependent epimerase/dehydratase family protein n=1 Tax=Actinophytocola sp. TaxID=1872138 RepID=UPI003D6BC71D
MTDLEQSRTVLVTGAAGLIGVPVIRYLRRSGFEVVAVDDGSAGTLRRLREFSGCPDVTVRVIDIRHGAELAGLVAAESPWGVIHLAARHFIPECDRLPSETLGINVMGTQNLIDACVAHPPRRVVFASTADVYEVSSDPHHESSPVGPLGVYGCSKLMGERLLCDQAFRLKGCGITIARLFNVYGPGDPHPHLIPELVHQFRRGQNLRLGDLKSARDFVYVDDAAEALVTLLEADRSGVFNVGTGVATHGYEVLKMVAGLMGRAAAVEVDSDRLRRRARPVSCATPDRLRELLPGWPRMTMREGIKRVIEIDSDTDEPRWRAS